MLSNPLRTGLTGRVAYTGEKVNIKGDAYQDLQFKPEIDWQAGYRVRSFLCMPLLRVRTKDGTERLTVEGSATLAAVKAAIDAMKADIEHQIQR